MISVPCFELFLDQNDDYRRAIIGNARVKIGVEAAVRQGWDAIIGSDGIFVGMTSFGASAPYKELYKKFGITAEAIAARGANQTWEDVTDDYMCRGTSCRGRLNEPGAIKMTVRVAINGFGRIGRNILRAIAEADRKDIEVIAVNDLGPVETNAHLLRYDSVHGRFPGTVTVKGDTISVGNGAIKVTAERDPSKLPWKDLGIDIAHGVHRSVHRQGQGVGAPDRRRQARAGLRACRRR